MIFKLGFFNCWLDFHLLYMEIRFNKMLSYHYLQGERCMVWKKWCIIFRKGWITLGKDSSKAVRKYWGDAMIEGSTRIGLPSTKHRFPAVRSNVKAESQWCYGTRMVRTIGGWGAFLSAHPTQGEKLPLDPYLKAINWMVFTETASGYHFFR